MRQRLWPLLIGVNVGILAGGLRYEGQPAWGIAAFVIWLLIAADYLRKEPRCD